MLIIGIQLGVLKGTEKEQKEREKMISHWFFGEVVQRTR